MPHRRIHLNDLAILRAAEEMGLTMDQRKGYAREMAKRYRKASKKKKGQLIEEYLS